MSNLLFAFLAVCAQWICERNSAVKDDFDYATEFYRQPPDAAPGTSCFFRRVVNAKRVTSARWMVSGLGVFEAYVNGVPVGAQDPDRPRLKPGFTDVRKTRHAYVYDILGQIDPCQGATNVLAAEVSSGWWRDRIVRFHGKRSAFQATLELTYQDGTRENVVTDPTWFAGTESPVRAAAIFDGEDFDARISREWMRKGDGEGFAPASVSTEFKGSVISLEGPWIRWREDLALRPRQIVSWRGTEGAADDRYGTIANRRSHNPDNAVCLRAGETLVVDFGQNCAAVPRFVAAAARGTRMRVLPREMLNDGNGLRSRGNDGPEGSVYLSNVRGARAEVNYTFSGDGRESYAPQFTYFGYRYLSITATGDVVFHSMESVPVSSISAAAEGGDIETGVPELNRFVENVRWSLRSNFLSVPTDCPQRNERLGWTADAQVFAPTATRFADVREFLGKWMRDMRDAQLDTGSFAAIAPFSEYDEDPDRFGWADAGIIVPHVVWKRYGDKKIIRDNWEAMKRQLARVRETRHELMPGCFQFADWLSFERYQPCGMPMERRRNPESGCRRYWNFLGACHWLIDARKMAEMAAAIGEDSNCYSKESDDVLAHIRRTYFTNQGELDPSFADLQGANAFALALGLFPDEKARRHGCQMLCDNIDAHGGCLRTGFLSTPFLLRALSESGEIERAYSLLLQHGFPSWLYTVDQGATTVWERWNSYTVKDGFGPVSMNSFNHYAYGSVVEWMFSTMAGIRQKDGCAGWSRFELVPQPDRRIGKVSARQKTPHGEIESAWQYEPDGSWTWTFSIPEGTIATVCSPNGSKNEYVAGHYTVQLKGVR